MLEQEANAYCGLSYELHSRLAAFTRRLDELGAQIGRQRAA
jgi:hypothetical protein